MRKRTAAWVAKVGLVTALLAAVGVLADPGRAMAAPTLTHQGTWS